MPRRGDDSRRVRGRRHRHADALLSRNADAGQRLPRLRRRARGIARARAGLRAQGRGRHGGSAPTPSACATAARWCSSFSHRRSTFRPRPTRSASASAYGADPARYGARAATVAQPVKVDNDLYVRDYAKCILCYKCVEACGTDAQNTFAIAAAGRGFDARISTEYDVALPDSACVYCGNCIGVCPTGALMFSSEHEMRARRRRGTNRARRRPIRSAPYCGVGCTLTLHVQDNEIVKVTSPLENSVTSGNLCIKGRFGYVYVQNRPDEDVVIGRLRRGPRRDAPVEVDARRARRRRRGREARSPSSPRSRSRFGSSCGGRARTLAVTMRTPGNDFELAGRLRLTAKASFARATRSRSLPTASIPRSIPSSATTS